MHAGNPTPTKAYEYSLLDKRQQRHCIRVVKGRGNFKNKANLTHAETTCLPKRRSRVVRLVLPLQTCTLIGS